VPSGAGTNLAALPGMLEHDRKQAGWSVARAAWELGVSIREYRELDAGKRSPSFETWDRICKLYGWPQTFVT
jgi:DNA-binding XRE family transcriptional regulator